MRRMSGTDSLFISGETPTWHQHIGGLVILDAAEVPGFGFDVVRTVSDRLPLIPKLTWKLKPVPLGLDRSVWVDDADVRHSPPSPPHHGARAGRAAGDRGGGRTDLEPATRPPLPAVGVVVPRRHRERSCRRGDEVPPLRARRRRGQRARDAAARYRTVRRCLARHRRCRRPSPNRATCDSWSKVWFRP